jgi:hypothetical protein
MKEQLSKYNEKEQLALKEARDKRLEQLSVKFKSLGQEKTVEALSLKDDQTLDEFEVIVDAAIAKANENESAPSVTSPSQAVEKLEEKTELSKEVKTKEKLEAPKQDFFKGVCGLLTQEQLKDHSVRARTL